MNRPPVDPLESNPLSTTTPRIVSLVPSITELLYDLELEQEVVGITKFCIHPDEWFKTKPRIGGTKTVDTEKVFFTMPTLILANKEENVKEQVEALREMAPVYVSDVSTLKDACDMIFTIGTLTGKSAKAKEIIRTVDERFSELRKIVAAESDTSKPRATYFIWREPYMAAGGDTFIHDMMMQCGLENVFADVNRYPEVSIEQLADMNCEWLLLSSEPYPFAAKHREEIQKVIPHMKILLVDGEMFSWYGSRLMLAPEYFTQLLQQIHAKQLNY